METNSDLTEEMRAAVDAIFARLPAHYQTEVIKAEIVLAVVRSKGVGRAACEAAARSGVVEMFASLDRVIARRGKLVPSVK